MAVGYNPRVVTDGLVLALDAGNTKSYPGSGTTWRDLSGRGNNGTLVNGVGYDSANGGSIVFDGTDDYISGGASTNYAFGTGDFSVECWVWRNGSQTENASLVITYPNSFGSAPNPTWQLCLGETSVGNNQNKLVFYIGLAANFRLEDPDIFPNQTWTHVAVTRSGSTVSLYKNASLIDSGTSSQNLSDDDLAIGVNRGGIAYWNGRISNVKLYKGKGLTPEEVQQNYNATKSRYQ